MGSDRLEDWAFDVRLNMQDSDKGEEPIFTAPDKEWPTHSRIAPSPASRLAFMEAALSTERAWPCCRQ